MENKQFGMDWTKRDTAKSAFLFAMHFIILVGLAGGLLLGNKLSHIIEYMRENGAYYLYAVICVMLLVVIMYLYFFFEDREVLQKASKVCILFAVLDLYFFAAWLMGNKIHTYARPVAFVALMIYVLINRKAAIFMNVIGSLFIFVTDPFTGSLAVLQLSKLVLLQKSNLKKEN